MLILPLILVPKFITLPRRRRRRRRAPDGTVTSPVTEREAADLAEAQRRSMAEQNQNGGRSRATAGERTSRRSSGGEDDVNQAFEAMLREVCIAWKKRGRAEADIRVLEFLQDQENNMGTRQSSVM